ncbi:TRAP transporter substrate-binding protein [Candidatus Neomarinimicrobiota bacterium]
MNRPVLTMFIVLLSAIAMNCHRGGRTTVIKLGHALDQTHPVHHAMVYMAERVSEKSQGTIRIDIYPSQQLGDERELLELLQIGSVEMAKVSAGTMEGFTPAYKALGLPYMYRDEAHRFKVLEGEIGKQLLLSCEKYWLRGLCYYDAGSRSFYTKEKPILSPADLEGMKIRTMESPTAVQMIQLLGGSATPIAWGELYTALQQGVVDGAENNPPSFHLSRHYEVCKHYSIDEHTSIPDVLIINTLFWQDLSPQEQSWVQEAADESAQHQKQLWKEASEKAMAEVQANGVKVYYPEKAAFARKVDGIYEEYRDQPEIYDLIKRIKAAY